MPRRAPLYRRYKLLFYKDRVHPDARVPHKVKNGKTIWFDVVDALDVPDARRMGERRHPDLICVPEAYPRQNE